MATSRAQVVHCRQEYAATLLQLTDVLWKLQEKSPASADCGALSCVYCQVLHTRAAEVVYPFSVAFFITKDARYLKAAKEAAAWLFRQQQENGSWKETPEEWTGTTTDQLLMLLLAYDVIRDKLSAAEKAAWRSAIDRASMYLYKVMDPGFASINYVATTTATLAKAYLFTQNKDFLLKARALAHRTTSKMDVDGFINGEGGRGIGFKLGVDLGYEMEMSLWGLGLYARLTNDTLVNRYVKASLQKHLFFLYPDGSLDNSWGIRMNKWTLYGGATSDGCQPLFALYAQDDTRFAAASMRNLQLLRACMQPNGLIGYGPDHSRAVSFPPCIYPTFTKAKCLAMAYMLDTTDRTVTTLLPADTTGWMEWFRTLDVVLVRTKNFMATITGYHYKDEVAGAKSKYMHRPTGGTMSHLWLKDHGALQVASVTEYSRPEPMSFPEMKDVECLTSRIAYQDSLGLFTNLYEYDCVLNAYKDADGIFYVITSGELKNRNRVNGGVAYSITYAIADDYIEKRILLTYHDAFPVVTITEPFVHAPGMTFSMTDSSCVMTSEKQRVVLSLEADKDATRAGAAVLTGGRNANRYRMPYPAVIAYPVEIVVPAPREGFTREVRYRLTLK